MNQSTLTLVMAQLDFLVGDIEGNAAKVLQATREAQQQFQADLVVFPELTLTGYPPEDLLFRAELHDRVQLAMQSLCRDLPKDCYICIGHPEKTPTGLYNSASVLSKDQVHCTHRKHHLPNYAVFDEKRYFEPGATTTLFKLKGFVLGIVICEDVWFKGPIGNVCQLGAEILLCLNASPFHLHKASLREQTLRAGQDEGRCAMVYVNLVGGQDELVFDGASFVLSEQGDVVAQAPAFAETLLPVTFSKAKQVMKIKAPPAPPALSELAMIYQALTLGIADYIHKNHFPGVLVGLSGGIDSSLTLALAADALGAERCHAVLMPSPYTLQMSIDDAIFEAEALGVPYSILPITEIFQQFLQTLAPEFVGLKEDITEENLQARIRGMLLMALSNKTGKMVLTTGNKSEMAVGYATLYGDMAGGLAPLKDVPKTGVYELAHFRNQQTAVIPQRVFTRAPTAELKANQTDQDSLPDYAILDAIMQLYVEENASRATIILAGFTPADVDLVLDRINRNEYKRRQSAPGIRISPRAFGRDWRLPLPRDGNHEKNRSYFTPQ